MLQKQELSQGSEVEKNMMYKAVVTIDATFTNCLVEQIENKKTPFPDNSFVRITEKGVTYLVNTDYIIFCEI